MNTDLTSPRYGGGRERAGWARAGGLLLLLLLLTGLWASRVRAQSNIDLAEYYLDTDPGFGAGTSIPITTPGTDVAGLSAAINVGSIGTGFHVLGLRTRTAAGTWSLTTRKTFFYEPAASNALADVDKVEYFLDTDPGFGAATDVPVTAGTTISGLAFGVNIGSLSTGFHRIGFRSRDTNGVWSITSRRTFYYEPAATAALGNITKVEYFLDADPGFDSATNVPITAGTDVSGVAFGINLSSLSTGFHTIGMRSKDANGAWSLTARKTFFYEPLVSTPLANIDRIEYFMDADPGLGSATAVTGYTSLTDVSGVAFTVPLGSLGTGFHTLGLRSRDANGAWSLTSRKTFYFEPLSAAVLPNLNKVEYFMDTDPGFGLATDVPFSAAADVAGVAIAVPLGSLAAGFHSLGVRSRDANGQWSLTNRRSFYFEPPLVAAPNITRIEYYFDTDPGFGSATNAPITAGPDLAGVGILADASALADGAHTLFIRSRDADGEWSLVSNRPFVKNGCGSSANAAAGLAAGNYAQAGSYFGGSAQQVFNNAAGSANNFGSYSTGYAQADFGAGNLQSVSDVRLRIVPQSNTNLTLTIQTSTNGTAFTTADTYTATLTANQTYDIARTLPTVATGVRAVRLVFGASPNAALAVSGAATYFFNCNGPTISSFTPTNGPAGTSVTLTGTNLAGITSVNFNGTAVPVGQITANTATSVTVVAPTGGTSGQICLAATAGSTCSAQSYAYPPTIATGTVSPTAFCSSTFISVPFTTNQAGYGVGNTFSFQLSDASGVFASGSRLYNTYVSLSGAGGTITDTVAFRTPAGNGYRVRVVSSNPVIIGTANPVNLTVYPTPVASADSNSPVAYNGSINLTAAPTGQSSYQWYVRYNNSPGAQYYVGSGQTLAVANAQPSQSGKYYVYVGNANGCQDSASVRVLVNPSAQPIVAISPFGGSYCAGSSTLGFSYSVVGNSFPSGNTLTAELSDASGSFAAATTLATVPFVGQGSGSFSVPVPVTTPQGSGYRVRIVASTAYVATPAANGTNLTINAQPIAVAGSNSPVAYGGTLQLTAAPVAGATYQWYGPGFYSTTQNPVINNATTGSNQGTYQLVVTVGACQNSSTTSVVVSPSNAPILTENTFANGPYCAGVTSFNIGFSVTGNSFGAGNVITAQLSDASGSFGAATGIGSVAFTGQGSGAVAVTIPANTPAGTGYRIRLAGSNPGVPSTADNGSNLTINAAPTAVITANSSPVAYSGTLTLTAQAVSGATYQWTIPGVGTVSSGSTPSYSLTNATPTNNGTATLTVTVGACTAQTTTSISVTPAGQPTLAIGQFGGNICAGASLGVGFAASAASFSGATITAQLSDAGGSFASAVSIGSTTFSGQGGGSIAATIPLATVQGGLYRIRLIASSAATINPVDNGSNISINTAATASASANSPLTQGATLQLSAATVAGATYGWTGPAGFSSVSQNPVINNVTGTNAGTYTLTVTLGTCQAQSQTTVVVNTPSATLATGAFSGSLCPGSVVAVPFTASGFGSGNVYSAQLSDAGGSFASAVSIGTLSGNAASGNIVAQIPLGTTAGTGYRIRVVASSPGFVSSTDNGTNLAVGAITYTWTGGNGNTNWFDPLNWSCGQVPTSTSVVIIPGSLTFYPVITGATVAVALNITIQTGAYFTNNGTFNLYGNVTVNSVNVTASSSSTWSFVGGITQYLYGSQPFYVGNVVIGTGTSFTMNNALYVSNYWTNNGSYAGGSSYNVYFNGTGGTQIIGGSSVTSFYNVYVNSGAVVNLGLNTIFLNNFVVNGSFSAVNYGVVFGGSTGQTIGGSGTSTYYNVTINNTVGVTLVSNITVLGNWINNGLFAGGTYSVIFAGTTAQIIGGTQVTNFYNVTFNNLISVTLNQNIYVLGGFVNTGIFYGYQVIGGVTTGYFVRFGGTVAQVINANATTYFYHFYVDNAAGLSLSTNIYIAGNYYLYAGSFAPGTFTVYFNGTGGLVQTVGGYTMLSFYGWDIVSGAYVRLLQNVTWLGSFANAGTFYGYNLVGGVYTGYTCFFGGSGAQVIGGGGVFEFWHVTWSNLAGITLNQNIRVWGNWLNNGGYFANGYLVNFIGNVAQLIGGSVTTTFHHVTITNLVSVTLNQPITVLGNWAGSGVFLGNGYLTYFNGTAAQTIFAGLNTRFFDLRFNNATSVTLLSNIYLAGNWTHDGGFVANGYAVYFSGTGATQIIGGTVTSLFYHLTILPSAQVQLGRVVTILGDWTNNGSFLHGNFTITFAGSIAQLIGGSTPTIFYGITFTNTVSVTLAQNIRVRGGWLNNGVFAPGSFIVYFDGSVAQVIGGSAVSTFFGLNIVNTVGVSLSGPIFIRGNLVNDGLFTCAGYLVTFNGTTLQSIGGLSTTIFGNITCNNAGGVALGQHIRVRGDFRNLALFTAGGYIVYFDGSIAQGIYCPTGTLTFHDVVFANLNGVTLQNNIVLTGSWTNNGGFAANGKLVTFAGSVLQLITGTVATVFHHFTIALGASVRQDIGITLLGNWANNGTFLHNNLLVYFNGTVLQTIAGTALSIFYDVTFNNAVNVSLGQNIDVIRHFVNQGGYCGCGFRTRFNGTVAQSITCTSGRTHFHDLTFANTAGVTLLDGIYVSGNWVNNGGYLANNQLVIFDGTAGQTIGGTVLTAFYHWQNTNASTAGVTLLRDVTYLGNWTNNGRYCGCGFLSLFSGSIAQTLTCTTGTSNFHHLTLANTSAGGVTLVGNINVSGNWLQSSVWNPATYTVFFNGTAGQSIGVGGSFTLAQFYGLTIANTSAAGVSLNCGLGLYGNFANNGVFACGLNTVFANGTTLQTFGGTAPTRFYSWTIQNPAGASCTGTGGTATTPALGLLHVLTLATGGGNLACGGNFTLISNATGTGMVVNQPGGGVCTGRATMERFITGLGGAAGYRHYSSPMQLSAGAISTTVQEFADDLPVFELNPAYNTVGNSVTPFPTLFQYDETRLTSALPAFDQGWLVPTATQSLLPLRGYSAQTLPTTTVDISGLLQTGNVSYSLTRGSLANAGWHLLGNPYPAPIDWDVVRNPVNNMLSGVADALYVAQPTGQYTGTYRSYVNGIGQNGGTPNLAAMQGFFVRATAPTASVSFTNAVRATSYLSPDFNRPLVNQQPGTRNQKPVIRLLARNVANTTADETVVYFEAGAALGFSPQHDAYKVQLNGAGRPSLWSLAGTDGFAINGLPDLATAPVIPLGVRVSVDGAHELLLADLADAPAGTQVWLEDRVLNRRQNLAASPRYAFTMLASYSGQRFYLNFVAGSPLAVTTGQLAARTALYPNPTTATATLELAGLREQGAITVEVLNVLGQPVQQHRVKPQQGLLTAKLDLGGLPTGVYTVRIHAQEGTVVKRLVKE